jgi:hypothetical protein
MKVPLIVTEPPPEFGELKTSPEFLNPSGMDQDLTYVPGFSELRFARDSAILEVMQGKRRANEVPTLPVNFRWARCQNKKGDPDNRKVIRAGNRGYRLVTKDQVGEGKLLKELPAGARWSGDGTVLQGDTVLMVADAERVARNEFQKRARTASATRGAEAGFAAALEAVGGKPSAGASPFINKEVGQRVRAELSPKTKAKET